MKVTTAKHWSAKASIGLAERYSNQIILPEDFENALKEAQENVRDACGVSLSAAVTYGKIVFLGQNEPTAFLSFIQYPKFTNEEETLQEGVMCLVEIIAKRLNQNRVVIEFPEETIMIEQSDEIDPNIRTAKTK